MNKNLTIIYCDGACSGNPGPGGWGAIVATPDGHVRELGGGATKTTNNQMELLAATAALRTLRGGSGEVVVYTDSVYVIKGITQWIFGWMKRGWKTAENKEVLNKEYWQDLSEAVGALRESHKISWKYVRGHTGIEGNERCDVIAVAFSKGKATTLYNGSILGYNFSVFDPPPDEGLPERSGPAAGPKVAPFSYISYVGGQAIRHRTWPECERRVKGQAGAKFKKTKSAEDEAEILRSWGLSPSVLKLG